MPNVLPHNPLTAANIFDEVKKLKGETSWLEFDLRCLTAAYPSNKVLSKALAEATAPPANAPVEEAPAKAEAKKKADAPAKPEATASKKKTANTKGRKTAAEVNKAEPADSTPPSDDDLAELGDIK